MSINLNFLISLSQSMEARVFENLIKEANWCFSPRVLFKQNKNAKHKGYVHDKSKKKLENEDPCYIVELLILLNSEDQKKKDCRMIYATIRNYY